MPRMRRAIVAAALLFGTIAGGAEEQRDPALDWPHVGGDHGHTKYSIADDVTAANVNELKVVWRWSPNERALAEYGTRPGKFQATPIMVGNVLYLSTMYTRVVALDAETGGELWSFDPKAYEGGPRGARPGG